MCGRYTLTVSLDELLFYYGIEGNAGDPFRAPRYNVAPGQMVPAVLAHDGKNRMGELRWGLIPAWAKDESIGYRTLNARAETLTEKPAFKLPFERKRVILPADGFFEWKKTAGGKQPYRFLLRDGGIFSLAGLYDTWQAPDGRKLSTCTIITVAPNRLLAEVHDRMPAILRREDEALWLDRDYRETAELLRLLGPYPAEAMQAYPVDPLVGNVKNDSPACIAEAVGG